MVVQWAALTDSATVVQRVPLLDDKLVARTVSCLVEWKVSESDDT